MDYLVSDDDLGDLPPVSATVFSSTSNHEPTSSNVADHYNARPNQSLGDRAHSGILHLRIFNNWVKSVMIREYIRGRNLKVLDLCCGKGGDLKKWDRLTVTHYTGDDIAAVSIEHAQQRYLELKPRFQGSFVVYDCFHVR